VIAITQHPSCGEKGVQANPGFLRLQTFAAQSGFLPTAARQITALAAMRRYRLASRRIEERKHADERDDDAAERDLRCAGCA
jgi:hypothetical protein